MSRPTQQIYISPSRDMSNTELKKLNEGLLSVWDKDELSYCHRTQTWTIPKDGVNEQIIGGVSNVLPISYLY